MIEIKNEPASFNRLDQPELNESPSSGCHDNVESSCMVNEEIKAPTPRYASKTTRAKQRGSRTTAKRSPGSTRKLKVKKRTPTSYDSETSFYLKSMFFTAYSTQKKLTKTQRLEVQQKTGLDSRKVTYWFSNHKRRSQVALEIYHDTINRSGGQVSNYEEFIMWRKSRGLTEHIGCAEIAAFTASKAQNQEHSQ